MRLLVFISSVVYFALISFHAHASSPVWKVSKGNSYLYIAGTIHLLSPADHPLPEAYTVALKDSDTVIFETDMKAAQSFEFAQKAAVAMLAKNGNTLDKALSKKAFGALSEYLAKNSIPPATLMMFTPTGAMLTLTLMEYQKLGMVQSSGVDTVMLKNAEKQGKKLNFLETPEEQLHFITNMALGDEDEMVLYTLTEFHKLHNVAETMKSAWRSGNLEKLNKLYMEELQRDFPNAYNMLIKDRNDKWIPKIEAMFHNQGTEYILVGALHLSGKDGVLTQLKKKGYKLDQLK